MTHDTDLFNGFDPADQTVTANDLQGWGVGFWAYTRPTTVDGQEVTGIFGADGEQLGVAPDRETAFAAIRQHEMEPVHLH